MALSMTDLTTDQRWLLYFMGGWAIRDCLIGPAGTDHLMQSMSGAWGHTHPHGGPAWMTGWSTRSGKITSPGHGEARVVISKAQINAYARGLPADIRAELIAVRDLDQAENARAYDWCYCPWSTTAPNAHSGPCTRYHPSHDEADAHRARARHIGDQLDDVLLRALRIGDPTAVQLELFAPG
ncbi:hypothetical protein AWC17_15460 [Mycobacterium nebraskense]|jgi:hypothetical protein|uniref:Uncharacterized protein n=2 Tax=Mycobacterium nebraskense TaxID=244292 RepID=A0A1X1YYH6_9MYCO|nr:hypothetical protein AWC17_15460 [Mycobacterium nebraskense]